MADRADPIIMQPAARRWVAWAIVIGLLAGIAVVDQCTKQVAQAHLMVWTHESNVSDYQGKRVPILFFGQATGTDGQLGNYASLNLNYVRNRGAAWGMLDSLSEGVRKPFFHVMTWFALGVMWWIFRRLDADRRWSRLALVMVAGGAAGNYIDRVRLGYVVDWIDVHWNLFGWRCFFPNFNIADVAITLGVLILAWDSIVRDISRKRS